MALKMMNKAELTRAFVLLSFDAMTPDIIPHIFDPVFFLIYISRVFIILKCNAQRDELFMLENIKCVYVGFI